MLANLKALFRYFNSAVPFRLVPALITTAVLVTLLLIPCTQGLNPDGWARVAFFLNTLLAS